MGLINLSIFIPSYKRPSVLEQTLNGLYVNTESNDNYNINIGVGLNKFSEIEEIIIKKFEKIFNKKDINFNHIKYKNNIGKANILNNLFKLYGEHSDLIITMDNDMVIQESWLDLISVCNMIDYDIMGFSSARFWAHDPIREKCAYEDYNGNRFYIPHGIAGGMMLFYKEFLKNNPWTNHGGVYGRDDAEMCLKTNKKYVLHSDRDWLVHDPLNSSTEILKHYEDRKKQLYKSGITVFKEGWDE